MKQASFALKVYASINFIGIFIFTIPGLVYFGILNLIGYLIRSPELRHYSVRCLVAPDQWWNAALLGEEDETVSSRLGRALKSGRPKIGAIVFAMFVNAIFRLAIGQKNHCLESIEEKHCEHSPASDETWSFIQEDS